MIDFRNDSSSFHLSENLRALRKRMCWSQEELAEKMGLNRGNIASYESGTAEPKICNLVKFARLFGISIFDLTHNDLKEDTLYEDAMQRNQNGGTSTITLAVDQYAREAKDFENAIKGLECISRMRARSNGELNEETTFYKNQFEQLHHVALHLLKSHVELIATVKSKCSDSR